MKARDVIALEGGLADLDAQGQHPLPLGRPTSPFEANSRADYAAIKGTLSLLGRVVDEMASLNHQSSTAIAVTQSTSMRCKARQLEDGTSLILIPIGMIERVRVMNRLLLSYWDNGSPLDVISSLFDANSGDLPVPIILWPLLRELQQPAEFWSKMAELDGAIRLHPDFWPDVMELNHLTLVHTVAHEFAHSLRRHFEVLASKRGDLGLYGPNLRRALECDADAVATSISVHTLIHQADLESNPTSAATGFLRLGYSITSLYALYDPHRRVLAEYAEGSYPHPEIRRELASSVGRAAASTHGLEAPYSESEILGWARCAAALSQLERAAMAGEWGEYRLQFEGDKRAAGVIHALRVPRFAPVARAVPILMKVKRRIREQEEQWQHVATRLDQQHGAVKFE